MWGTPPPPQLNQKSKKRQYRDREGLNARRRELAELSV